MPLLLSNADVDALLPMSACIEAIEAAYRQFGNGRAVIRPRSDVYVHSPRPNSYYVFKSMEGALTDPGVVALRVNSDCIAWSRDAHGLRKDKIPVATGGRWVGLVFLFSTETGELVAILPDGAVQRLRVAATAAVAARRLARRETRSLALYGSGWQAGAAARAMAAVLPELESIRVWSPTAEHRERFAHESAAGGLPVHAVGLPEEAAEAADAIVAATNALDPVVQPEWVRPGMFLTCVKMHELGPAILDRADRVFVHVRKVHPLNYIAGRGEEPTEETDPVDLLFGMHRGTGDFGVAAKRLSGFPDLADLLVGRAGGRERDEEITVFLNTIGTGLQFAALCAEVWRRARQRGAGHELPGEWFTEDVHS